jgi:hypothetical protein
MGEKISEINVVRDCMRWRANAARALLRLQRMADANRLVLVDSDLEKKLECEAWCRTEGATMKRAAGRDDTRQKRRWATKLAGSLPSAGIRTNAAVGRRELHVLLRETESSKNDLSAHGTYLKSRHT